LTLADVEEQANAFVELFLLRVLAEHRFQDGGCLLIVVTLERFHAALVQGDSLEIGRSALRPR
jgi:hypothetical protein